MHCSQDLSLLRNLLIPHFLLLSSHLQVAAPALAPKWLPHSLPAAPEFSQQTQRWGGGRETAGLVGKIPHLGGPQGNKANWMGECTLVWGQRRLWCWKSPPCLSWWLPLAPQGVIMGEDIQRCLGRMGREGECPHTPWAPLLLLLLQLLCLPWEV